MKFEDFTSGSFQQQYRYKSFLPGKINREWTWDDGRINVLLEQATRSLAELDAFTQIVPDVDLFIAMHIAKEANTSSRLEGTRTELKEAILDEGEVSPDRRDDWHEVRNYMDAMNAAVDELNRLPLSLRLLRNTHSILMKGVRGAGKTPGDFRISQNWIGGASLETAAFIPPHHAEIPDLLADLEAFWHNEEIHVPHLIRIAISHYQFETIHPFLDGNGRIGRLLITLYLLNHGLLQKPSLYLSAYLERHRTAYYDALSRVRESDDLSHWCRFFLEAVIQTAAYGKLTFQRIFALRKDIEQQVLSLGRRAEMAQRLIRHLYSKPAVTVNQTMDLLGINYNPANNLLSALADLGILNRVTSLGRSRLFVFTNYLDVFLGENER